MMRVAAALLAASASVGAVQASDAVRLPDSALLGRRLQSDSLSICAADINMVSTVGFCARSAHPQVTDHRCGRGCRTRTSTP